MKKVTAIINTHNRIELLKRAIDSVKKQTYQNIEIIVIDDASDDGTKDYCEKLKDIIYVYIPKNESRGGNYARNIGVKNSTGHYIAFLDDDDEWYPTKIEKQVEILDKKTDISVVYCGRRYDINNGSLFLDELPDGSNKGDCSKRIFYNVIGVSSMLLFRREIFDNITFDEDLKFWQDYDLMIRIFQKYKVDYINECLILYRKNLNDKNRLTNKFNGWLNAVNHINEKYADLINNLSDDERKKRNIMIYYDAANRCSTTKDKKGKRMYLKLIFKNKPNLKNYIKYIFNIEKNDLIKFKIKFKKILDINIFPLK